MNDGVRDRTGESKDEAILSELDMKALLLRKLDADLFLLTTSWLTSSEATWLRSTSQTSCRLVVRNIPVSTADFAYCEAVALPDVAYVPVWWPLEQHPHFNCFSPLRCWRFRWANIQMSNAPSRLKRDKAFVLAAVTQYGGALEYADESFRSDRDVVLAAVTKNGRALEYADESFRSDRDVVLAAVTKNGRALQWADGSFRSDRDVVLAAVTQNGLALRWADGSFESDRDVVLAAVTQNRMALNYVVDRALRLDPHILAAAS